METKQQNKSYILGISILMGMITLGYFIFLGLKTFSDKDRIVTVKGLAEIDMKATAANLLLSFSFSGDNLEELIHKTNTKKDGITSLIKTKGMNEEMVIQNIDITDRESYYEEEWQEGKKVKIKIDRYTVTQKMYMKSSNIEQTENIASNLKLDLINNNLTSEVRSSYEFPELNSVKPQLIAESTVNARIAGEQFANDSKAKLGKIKTASQGPISIAGSYNYDEDGSLNGNTAAYIQRARVVSTIVFFLE